MSGEYQFVKCLSRGPLGQQRNEKPGGFLVESHRRGDRLQSWERGITFNAFNRRESNHLGTLVVGGT